MAQINTQTPDMSQYFGGNAAGMINALEQRDQAMRGNEINQQQALQDMFQSGEKHPLDMQALRDVSDTRQAQLPGHTAESFLKTMEADDQEALGDIFRQDVKKSEGKVKITAGKERELAHDGMIKFSSDNPTTKAEGKRILEALNAHEDMKQEAMQKRQIALERTRGEEDRKTNDALAKAGKFTKNGGGAKGSFDEQAWLKNPVAFAIKKTSEAKTPEEKAYWEGMVAAYSHPKIKELETRAAAMAAGSPKIDLSGAGVTTATVPQTPAPNIPSRNNLGPGAMPVGGPIVKPGPKTPAHMDWVKRAMTANPGMTEQQAIERGEQLGKFK